MGWIGTALGLGSLAAAAYLLARHGFRQAAGPSRWLGGVVLGWAWVTWGVEILGSLGHLGRWPLVLWSAGAIPIAGAVALLRPGPADPEVAPRAPARPGLAATIAVGLVLWASYRIGLVSLLFPVKVVSDGPIYHLYFAARWWKAGRVFPVATPFGEVGATYFWANGEAWFAWLMTLWGGDAWAKLGQVPFLAAATAAVHAMARRAGASASSATVASAWFASVAPLLLYTFEPNVDVLFVAGYLLACSFFLRYALGDDGLGSLALGAIAAGLGMGTKPTGIVFFPPLIALATIPILARTRTARGRLGHLAALAILPATTAGFWPIRNALLTGNPLYPLRVEAFGRAWLPGWFGPGAMSRSPYYIPVGYGGALVDILLAVLDPRTMPLWLLALLGAWAIGRRGRDAPPRWVWWFSALALANLALYWLAIPYRTQQRFMLQALGLASVPLALTIDRAAWVRAAAVVMLALHILTPQVWPVALEEHEVPWDRDARIPNVMPSAVGLPIDAASLRDQLGRPGPRRWLETTILLGVGAFPLAWLWLGLPGSKGLRRPAAALAGSVGLAAAGAWWLGGPARQAFPAYPDFYVGWTELELRSGPRGVRVAYAGTSIPYYLLGGSLRNEVRYVNIDRHRDWLMHDYHAAARSLGLPETWDDPFPGWDRLRPDYAAWLANLRAEGIEILAVTRVNFQQGGQHNIADRDFFPIERAWAESHPESFEPIHGVAPPDPWIRLYRVRHGENPGISTDRGARPH